MELWIHLLIYYIVLSILLYGSLAYNPRMWLHRMPPGVIAKVPAKTPGEKRLLLMTAIPFLLLVVGYPIVYILQLEANWLDYFLILCAFLAGFDVWDTLILDLLIFCKLTPGFIIIAGTEREDYAETKYHLVSGLKGLVISIIFSGVLATILYFYSR
ncbi:MAG: hypothetical protein AB1894_25140 [Chloroflexota bacterium]